MIFQTHSNFSNGNNDATDYKYSFENNNQKPMILIQFHNKRNHTSVLMIDVCYHIETKPVELVLNINLPSAVVFVWYILV